MAEELIEHLERAWILVITAEAEATAVQAQVYALNEKLPWPNQHIIRIDVVKAVDDALPYNLVAPVWARDAEGLASIRDAIGGLPGVEKTQMVVVQRGKIVSRHYPLPPHKARGYVTLEEVNPVEPGPTGINAWG
jgi:hypothetical protein